MSDVEATGNQLSPEPTQEVVAPGEAVAGEDVGVEAPPAEPEQPKSSVPTDTDAAAAAAAAVAARLIQQHEHQTGGAYSGSYDRAQAREMHFALTCLSL